MFQMISTRPQIAALGAFLAAVLTSPCPGQCSLRWQALGGGVTGPQNIVTESLALPNGDVVIAGYFASAGGVAAANIARWDGITFSPLGAGLSHQVNALALTPNGDIVAAGSFNGSGTTITGPIARWDGTAWLPFAPGVSGPVRAMAASPNGEIFISGVSSTTIGGQPLSGVARWNGASWQLIGPGPAAIGDILSRANGDLIICGGFSFNGYKTVLRWDGATWQPMGSGPNGGGGFCDDLLELPNGDVVACGTFATAGGATVNQIARWNGSSWSGFGSGILPINNGFGVHALALAPNGDLLAGGRFNSAGGQPAARLARWDGSSWSEVAGGVYTHVYTIATAVDGSVVVGGLMHTAGTLAVQNVALVVPTCPATATQLGTGCAGSGGLNTLTATALAWSGGTYRATASGFAGNSLAADVFGFATLSVPLSSIHPTGLPGCSLWITSDIALPRFLTGGTVQTAVPFPSAAAFAGLIFHHQVVAAELNGQGQLTALTGTNAITLQLGSF